MMWQTSEHNKSLELILKNPGLAGINGVVDWRKVEFPFYNSRGKLLGSVDIIINSENGLYIVEYKCSDHDKSRMRAKEQLLIGKKGLREQYGFRVDHMLYVHDNFITEELLDKFVLVDNREYVIEYERRFETKK